jgi:hypothetical protein
MAVRGVRVAECDDGREAGMSNGIILQGSQTIPSWALYGGRVSIEHIIYEKNQIGNVDDIVWIGVDILPPITLRSRSVREHVVDQKDQVGDVNHVARGIVDIPAYVSTAVQVVHHARVWKWVRFPYFSFFRVAHLRGGGLIYGFCFSIVDVSRLTKRPFAPIFTAYRSHPST